MQADPPLEINRNLTNWGMTYKQEMPARSIPSRRTWQNETFIKNELDLVNSKESVPHITDEVRFYFDKNIVALIECPITILTYENNFKSSA